MNRGRLIFLSVFALLFSTLPAVAHFGMVIPSTNVVKQDKKSVNITLSFSHPFEVIGMNLEKPTSFYSIYNDQQTDLLPLLKKATVMNHQAWKMTLPVKRPGVYHLVMVPQPYWEPAEDLHIIHYTKTTIAAFGAADGWDSPVGLPTEIVPLLRPFGNTVGNTFTGKVMIKGKPASNVEVEVEYYNEQRNYNSPSDYHITQVIKTNADGEFHFTCNLPGWWGFSALSEAEYTLADPDGTPKGVELGAVFWLYFHQVKKNNEL